MINIDQYVTAFISNNWISLTMFLGLLKIFSEMTDWAFDNKIYTLLSGLLNMLRGKPPVGVPALKDRGEELK